MVGCLSLREDVSAISQASKNHSLTDGKIGINGNWDVQWHSRSQTYQSRQYCGVQYGTHFDDWEDVIYPFVNWDKKAGNAWELEELHVWGADRIDKIATKMFGRRQYFVHGGSGGDLGHVLTFKKPTRNTGYTNRVWLSYMSIACCKAGRSKTRVCALEFGSSTGEKTAVGWGGERIGGNFQGPVEFWTVGVACCRVQHFAGSSGAELDSLQVRVKKNSWYAPPGTWEEFPGIFPGSDPLLPPPPGMDDPNSKRSLRENAATLRSDRVRETALVGDPHDPETMERFNDTQLWQSGNHHRISKLTLYCDTRVNGLQFEYDNVMIVDGKVERGNATTVSELHGERRGTAMSVDLIHGDYLHGLDLSSCRDAASNPHRSQICSITVHTYGMRTTTCGKHANDFRHHQLYSSEGQKHSIVGLAGSTDRATGTLRNVVPVWIPEEDHH